MTYKLTTDIGSNTFRSQDIDTLATEEFTSIRKEVMDAFKGIDEVYDILFEKINMQIKLIIITKKPYSNDLLVEFSKKQLQIIEKLQYYLFSFDYTVKQHYKENKLDVSIFRTYASR